MPLIIVVECRAQFPGDGAADRAGRAGLELLGGYGGQYSFGHAAFFGTGAYVTAILQMRYGVNAWLGFAIGIAAGALVGAVIGALSFRSGLKGSYFALVTLAFAEVLRIVASVAPITGAGVGTLIKLDLRPGGLSVPEPRAVLLDRSRHGRRLADPRPDDRSTAASAPISSPCVKTRMPPRRSASMRPW